MGLLKSYLKVRWHNNYDILGWFKLVMCIMNRSEERLKARISETVQRWGNKKVIIHAGECNEQFVFPHKIGPPVPLCVKFALSAFFGHQKYHWDFSLHCILRVVKLLTWYPSSLTLSFPGQSGRICKLSYDLASKPCSITSTMFN